MIKILNEFLLKRFFYSIVIVLLTLSGIIFTITFVERLSYTNNLYLTLIDSFGRLLNYIPLFLPIVIFIATLLTIYKLINSNEYVILESIGLSRYKIVKPFLILAFFIGCFSTGFLNYYAIKINNKYITENNLKLIDNNIWLREVVNKEIHTLVSKKILIDDTKKITLFDNTLYIQKPNFIITRIESPLIVIQDEKLNINNATIWNKNISSTKKLLEIQTKLNKKTILDRYLLPSQISFWKLPFFIKNMKGSGIQLNEYLVQFWTLLFMPITLISMTILSIAFTHTKSRRNYNFIIQFILGILSCFILYFLINLFNSLGTLGYLPSFIVVLIPQLIIISIAGIIITSQDKL